VTAPSAEALAGRRVAVTGARGFLGRHVVAELERAGALALPVASDRYDLVDRDAVRRLYADLQPQVVVHAAAAVGGIGANVANPGHFLHANAVMGLHLLEEARLAGLERFVLVSTTCTYPEDAPNPLRENTIWDGAPTGATGPYGMAKRLLHEACATFERQYGLSSAVAVLANLYGPGDHYAPETSHVAPMMARRYLEAARDGLDEVVNWGSGTPTREFLHVTDAARAAAPRSTWAPVARPRSASSPRCWPPRPATPARPAGTPPGRTAPRAASWTSRGPSRCWDSGPASGSRRAWPRPWPGCARSSRASPPE
jgi:nucleoside-diphosphate-sugar epimerase